jgi:CheY-like chemotaxis protein
MNYNQAYAVLKEIVQSLGLRGDGVTLLPQDPVPDMTLEETGVDLIAYPDFLEELKQRFNGKTFHLEAYLIPDEFHCLTVGRVLTQLSKPAASALENPEVVYVDDEEENLFVFKRKFGKELNLKMFTNPVEALEYIRANSRVGLVITDEVMPKLSGNELSDEIHKTKPNMKFILITGNPNQDDDLMYRSLRRNRFYEFINKPMNLEKNGEQYLSMIRNLLASD